MPSACGCESSSQYKLALPEAEVAAAMINSMRLTAAEALDHAKVEAELVGVILDWIERWPDEK